MTIAIINDFTNSGDLTNQGTNTITITKPAGADIVVVCFGINDGTTAGTIATPANWTQIGTVTSTKVRVYAFSALGAVGNLGFSHTQGTFTDAVGWFCLGFTGVDTTTPIDVAGTGNTSTGAASVTLSALTIVTANAWDCAVGSDWNEGTVTMTNFTIKQNANLNCNATFAYNTTPKSTGSTGTAVWNDSASSTGQILAALRFALRPSNPFIVNNPTITRQAVKRSAFYKREERSRWCEWHDLSRAA